MYAEKLMLSVVM